MAATKINPLEQIDRDQFKVLFLEMLQDDDVKQAVREIVRDAT
jgi:hypothetical protein